MTECWRFLQERVCNSRGSVIRLSYVPESNFEIAFRWLAQNSYGHNKSPRKIKIGETTIELKTDYLYINENFIKQDVELKHNNPIDTIDMSLSLIFDLDSSIIKLLDGGYSYGQTPEKLDGFILPNNQIWVGALESEVRRISKYKIYRFEFKAVTSDMSLMLKDSYSSKNWFLEFSKESSSLISFFDFEGEEKFVFYKGREIRFNTKSLPEQNDKNIPQNIVNEFYRFETELHPNYNFCLEKFDPIHERINIIEGDY